mmetsp:Transcript_30496/g.73075  ORF Transcript_30496/g.73075 Transcript_30496/m.73075 type:complete len:238 (-) Transcript_30496:956-1669(-)
MVPLQVPAVLHELTVVQHLQGVPHSEQRLDHSAVWVVDEHEDVGELQGGLFANGDTRGQAVLNRLLRGANQALGIPGEIVLLQINRNNQPLPRLHRRRLPVDQHEPRGLGLEDPISIVLIHTVPDPLDDLPVGLVVRQIDLGEDQVEGGWTGTHDVLNGLPVLGLGGVLVAGHHAPLGEVRPLAREHHARHLKRNIRVREGIRAAEPLGAGGPHPDLREPQGLARQVQHVAQQDGEG